MKNKGLIILIISVVIVVIISIVYVFNIKNLDYNLLNTKWYHYDYKSGYYEIFYLNESALTYYDPNVYNKTDEYSFCKKYRYNRINNVISLDCGKKIYIKEVNNDYLKVDLDSKEIVFYKNIDESIKHEFNSYFEMDMSEYKHKYSQALEVIKIDKSEIINILNEKEYSKIIFIGNNCNNVSCILINDVIEKWISFSKNIYFIDSNSLDKELLNKINKIDEIFSVNENEYNDIYPLVYVVSNNSVVDSYKIKCNGFNCSMYYNK